MAHSDGEQQFGHQTQVQLELETLGGGATHEIFQLLQKY